MRDLANNLTVARAISPVSVADNAAQVSEVFNRLGHSAVALIIAAGSLADADATFAVLMEESADNAAWNAVTDDDLNGLESAAGFTFAEDNKVRKIGYNGSKLHVRATITPTGNASAALMSAVWVAVPDRLPAANPPA